MRGEGNEEEITNGIFCDRLKLCAGSFADRESDAAVRAVNGNGKDICLSGCEIRKKVSFIKKMQNIAPQQIGGTAHTAAGEEKGADKVQGLLLRVWHLLWNTETLSKMIHQEAL